MDRFEKTGSSYSRDGVAKGRGMRSLCKKKLCILSTDKEFIFDMMYEASQANDCFQVKIYDADRFGVYMGKCSFTNDSSLGDAWARYESHPKAWAVIHDDKFCETFKGRIRNYDN